MSKITTISIDIESYSSVSLKGCGVYKYAEAPDAELLLFGYSADGEPVTVIDVAQGEKIPKKILAALSDDTVTKWAYNASFERIFLSIWLKRNYPEYFRSYSIPEDTVGNYLNPTSWKCTMTWAAYMGLPLSLEQVGAVLKLSEQKMSEGKNLIRFFSVPRTPTKNNPATRNYPADAPDRWEVFKEYNKRDVEVEMQIQQRLTKFPVPDFVWDEYHLSEEINDRGIKIDRTMVQNSIAIDDHVRSDLMEKMKALTNLENPNSNQQLQGWLSGKGIVSDSLDKKAIKELLPTVPTDIQEVLQLKQQISRSSVKKYQKMMDTVCEDGRARGMFMFYGANRTGRWAGRHIQLQNLPQNNLNDLAEAREIVKNGDYEMLSMLYEDIPDTLSQLIRTAFIPKPGYQFYVSDFSAIEARVLAHISGEKWRSEVFRRGEDIYCASASAMFHVPVEKHGQNAHLRQKGKIAELALGYGGSVGALKSMGALDMGMAEEELQPLVNMWRNSNPNIVALWWNVDNAAKECIKTGKRTETHGIRFTYENGMMFITLPSGRRLAYAKPRIGENQFGGESITYMGVDAQKKWNRIESYGPKIVENITQAISRDILAYAMRTLSHCFICGHVHDELIIECKPEISLEAVCEQMGRTPPWIPGIELRGDGYRCGFYMKD